MAKIIQSIKKNVDSAKNNMQEIYNKLYRLPLLSSFKALILIIITILVLYFVLSKVDFDSMVNLLFSISPIYITLLVLLTLIEMYIYSKRFTDILGVKYSLNSYLYYTAGFSIGRVIPPRPFGEYLRITTTMHFFKTSLRNSFFAVIVDNLYDIIALIFFAILSSLILGDINVILNIFTFISILLGIFITFYLIYSNFNFLKRIFGIKYIYFVLNKFRKSFYNYFKNMFLLKQDVLIHGVFLTMLIYMLSFTKMYIIFRILGADVSFINAAAIWSIANLLGSVSMLPGGIGAFELTIMYLGKGLGINETIAVSSAIVERFFNVWLLLVLSVIYLVYTNTPIQRLNHKFIEQCSALMNNSYKSIKGRINKIEQRIKK